VIIVTGTKRSGTSMWMQVLIGAGFPFIGRQFPARWQSRIGAANPEGFYESSLRRGVPVPGTPSPELEGRPLDPAALSDHVVKIFVSGVVRTDHVYLSRVIGSMRAFREYEQSRRRMWQMEDDARRKEQPGFAPPPRLEPVHEWWSSNYALIVDALRRRYPFNLCTYDAMLDDPEATIRAALQWLGKGELKGALAAVKAEHRTQRTPPTATGIEPEIASVFDELYDLVRTRRAFSTTFMQQLDQVQQQLAPRIRADMLRLRQERAARKLQTSSGEDE
jgi:hypothetical protein